MKFNYKKIASVLASVVMLGSTIGIAAAANYPTPFVSGGAANVAVVYGSNAAFSDGLAAGDIQTNLQAELAKQTATSSTTTSTGSCSGECGALFTGSSKIYVNDTITAVMSSLTETELPVVLKDGSFSGNVDATYTQTINLGSNPQITFAKQPTSSDDPQFGLTMSSSTGNYIYNATATFNKAINATHLDSKNQQLTLFGKTFTIASATDGTNLVLLKESTKLNFDSAGTTSQEVTVAGKAYTIELVSASATTATIKVTDAAGTTEQKEVSEGASKKINGVTMAVSTADTNNLKYTASLVAGAEKYTLTDGSAVTSGDSGTVIDGTIVDFGGTTSALTGITISVFAPSSDSDAILPGKSFTDPVYGSFKLDFPGMNIADVSTSREDLVVKPSGDDKLTLGITDYRGNAKTIQYVFNGTTGAGASLSPDTDGHRYTVGEWTAANKSDYIVIGNEDEGRLVKVYEITNQTSGYDQDKVKFQDVFSGDIYDTTITADGTGTVTIGGKVYNVRYFGNNGLASDSKTIKLDYPDSASGKMILYPTIRTSKGANIAFYKPLTINLTDYLQTTGVALTGFKFPNGARNYQDIDVAYTDSGNFTVGTTVLSQAGNFSLVTITSTGFTLNFSYTATNTTTVYLVSPQGGNIVDPAIFIYEEKDDNNRYEGMVVATEPGQDATDGIGVSDVVRTFEGDVKWDSITLASDSKKLKEADLYGAIITVDNSDSDQNSATISYPDSQIYAQLYFSDTGSTVSGGATSSGSVSEIGNVLVKDSEVSSVSTKNLIVVGGSCINTVAAKILGSDTAKCSADFTALAGISANQALIKVVTSPYAADKVAMLVAGYEAADTTKAVKYVTTEKPATAVDTTVKLSTSSTVATVAA